MINILALEEAFETLQEFGDLFSTAFLLIFFVNFYPKSDYVVV
jgi:hypothetical protein